MGSQHSPKLLRDIRQSVPHKISSHGTFSCHAGHQRPTEMASRILKNCQIITASSCLYAQSVSSQIRIKVEVSVILNHNSYWVTTDLKLTFDPNRGMRAVQRCEDTVYTCCEKIQSQLPYNAVYKCVKAQLPEGTTPRRSLLKSQEGSLTISNIFLCCR